MFSSNLKEGRVWESRRIIRNKGVIMRIKDGRGNRGDDISKIHIHTENAAMEPVVLSN